MVVLLLHLLHRCSCCLPKSSGSGRGLSGTVAATVSREQRREGGGEREEKEEEEDAVAAVRSRGRPTSPPTKGWILLPAEFGQRSRHKLEVIGHSTLEKVLTMT